MKDIPTHNNFWLYTGW